MIDAFATSRSLPWSGTLPRRRARVLAPGTRARAAARHGVRAALQALCLTAALMAAAGAVGSSRGPVELSEPAPAHHTAAQVQVQAAMPGAASGAGLAARVTSR